MARGPYYQCDDWYIAGLLNQRPGSNPASVIVRRVPMLESNHRRLYGPCKGTGRKRSLPELGKAACVGSFPPAFRVLT